MTRDQSRKPPKTPAFYKSIKDLCSSLNRALAKVTAKKNPATPTQATIKAVNEHGQVLGYLNWTWVDGSCTFLFGPEVTSLPFDVPVAEKEGTNAGSRFRIRRAPIYDTQDWIKHFPFLGIQHAPPRPPQPLFPVRCFRPGNISTDDLEDTIEPSKERWLLRSCQEERPGSIYRDRSDVVKTFNSRETAGPAYSCVWTSKMTDGMEELKLFWPDDDGALVPMIVVGDVECKYGWLAAVVYKEECPLPLPDKEIKVRLFVERSQEARTSTRKKVQAVQAQVAQNFSS